MSQTHRQTYQLNSLSSVRTHRLYRWLDWEALHRAIRCSVARNGRELPEPATIIRLLCRMS